jgi:flavin reductase (DIM6/NTAB) family NADH-FMN oxidoreductase RutF
MALADVPLECSALAYRLGEHHSKEHVDWKTLPFETNPSPAHGLPVLRDALRVRDVEVRQTRVVGSHTLFVTEVVHDARWKDGLQMFHLSGPYYRYLLLRGRGPPLP